MDGRTDGWMDGWMEFLPILQDLVPCRGRCPAMFCDFTSSKRQGKGTADLMMPFGVLLFMSFMPAGPIFYAYGLCLLYLRALAQFVDLCYIDCLVS